MEFLKTMKVSEFDIIFDEEDFKSGEKLNGKLVVKTTDQHLGEKAKIFVKLYDKLHIQWEEYQMHTLYTRLFQQLKKPFQLNIDLFLNKNDCTMSQLNQNEFEFTYQFSIQLPEILQGTVNLPNASCNYYIKAYLTNDDSVSHHYQKGANVFEEFFKSLNHTYCKRDVKIYNKTITNPPSQIQKYQTLSADYKIVITLPKTIFFSDEKIHIHVEIKHSNQSDQTPLKIHKIAFKLYQYCKVYAEKPQKKCRLFDYLLTHTTRKNVEQNTDNSIVLDEYFLVPKDLYSTTTRKFNKDIDVNDYDDDPEDLIDNERIVNVIRVNYKLGLEFWKNFIVEDSEINIPIEINPEV